MELARVLLEHGADVNAQDKKKSIRCCIRHRNENGADVQAQCTSRKRRRGCLASGARRIKNRTPLRLASGHGRVCATWILLEGVDAQARGTAGNLFFKSIDDLFEEIVHHLLQDCRIAGLSDR
jgi:hypothetical protein